MIKKFRGLPKQNGEPAYLSFVSDKATFYFPRFNNNDRLHSVINPVSYLFTSALIAKNYRRLRDVERASRYSLSASFFDWTGQRALRRPVFSKRDDFTSQLSPRFEYTVTTDLRAFYHSVYTGSIPWALHGKGTDPAVSAKFFGNELSLLVRNGQGGQTTGLPVGPDTSRILAEAIASRMDSVIDGVLHMNAGDASRFVDDYTFGCNSTEEGYRIIAEVRRAAAEFELDIGKEKTAIEPTDHLAWVGWQDYLKAHLPEAADKSSFERYFYVVNDMTKRQPKLNIEKFAMSSCRKALVDCADWRFLQDHIVSSYRRNSTLIDTLVEAMLLRHEAHRDLDLVVLTDFVTGRLPVLAANQRSGEIIWLLYLVCALRIKISAVALSTCIRMPNSLIAVLASYAERQGLVDGEIDLSYWQSFATSEGLRSNMFLYAYEAARNGWIDDISYCSRDGYYREFLTENVAFFDMDGGWKNISQVLKERKRDNMIARILAAHNDIASDPNSDFDDLDFEDFDISLAEPDIY
ncbi:RNA-directed DNA polymerase [Agrobacterium cavarae]